MAFDFSSNHRQEIPLEGVSAEQFLALALEAAEKRGWKLIYVSKSGFIAHTHTSMSSWGEEVVLHINTAAASVISRCMGNEFVDWGKNKLNIDKFTAELNLIKTGLSPEELNLRAQTLPYSDADIDKEHIISQSLSKAEENTFSFFSIFKPVKGYFVTPILININIAVFVIMMLSGVNIIDPDVETLIGWGAGFRPLVMNGEWWRLFTSIFLHIGIMHLLFNMYALLYIGLLLEPRLGKTSFLATYLLTGIAASVASVWWNDFAVSAGASGAIFGMYGVFLALLTTNIIEKSVRKPLLISIAVFTAYNLLYGIKDGVDNAAHIGGLLSGIAAGYLLYPSLTKPGDKKRTYAAIALLSLIVCVGSVWMLGRTTTYNLMEYDKNMQTFSEWEDKAMEVYALPDEVSEERLALVIETKTLYYWAKNKELIEKTDSLNLPPNLHKKNQLLREYCDVRIAYFNALLKAVKEDTTGYDSIMQELDKQLEDVFYRLEKVSE